MAHNYEVGTRAWQPDATEGWVASEVTEKKVEGDKIKLVFALENGEVSFQMSYDVSIMLKTMLCRRKLLRPPNKLYKMRVTSSFHLS